ncbi:MAG: hypothetical protein J6K12_02880 [Clostridia bacterium]|nr:hypothetical protein [Clostridia bacterium]
MKKYIVPEMQLISISASDILAGSDTDTCIDGGILFGAGDTANLASEYTGEPIEE